MSQLHFLVGIFLVSNEIMVKITSKCEKLIPTLESSSGRENRPFNWQYFKCVISQNEEF